MIIWVQWAKGIADLKPLLKEAQLNDAQEAGAVFLSEQGCGYASLMVMTGPHRGSIWDDLRPMDGGIVSTGHDFAYWYRSWLERIEQQLDFTSAPPNQRETL
ncbi:hypothetical protein [Streptomyces xanthophaeus]|uniref:hypothetical protein n=1 Tax=Streptomyces xanthophaeus TaxID=67385 RepID=UPI00131AF34E|nr:hypothetical protein [Streptomyces xanthophaeus]